MTPIHTDHRTTTDRSAALVSGMDSQNPSAHLGELGFNGKLIRLAKPLAIDRDAVKTDSTPKKMTAEQQLGLGIHLVP